MKKKSLGIAVLMSSSIVAGIPQVAAQALEEIIVSAQKRDETIQEVPIAVAAFSGESIRDKGVDSVAQLANLTPSVQLSATSQFFSSPSMLSGFIRGVGQDDFSMNFEPGVGTYIDGVYLARNAGSNVDLLDVERIEILKGPQGTLFGRNSIGGAISVVTRQPEEAFSFTGEVTAGSFNRMDVGGLINIPLIEDKLLSSLAFSSKQRDGWQERERYPGAGGFVADDPTAYTQVSYKSDDESGGINDRSMRGKLRLLATDKLEVNLAVDYSYGNSSGAPGVLLDVQQEGGLNNSSFTGLYNACINLPAALLNGIGLGAACGPRGTLPGIAGVNADADPNNDRPTLDDKYVNTNYDKSYGTSINFSELKSKGFTGIVDYDLDVALLKSITAYRTLLTSFGQDLDQSPAVGFEGSIEIDQEQFSQEFQFSGDALDDKLSYLAGLYYFREEGDLAEDVIFPGGLFQIDAKHEFLTESYAAFFNMNYRLNDLIGFTFGARYTEEDKELDGSQRDLNTLLVKLGIPAVYPDPTDLAQFYPQGTQKQSFSNFSPKVGIELHPGDWGMLYASYSQGFKSGGWTTRISQPTLVAPTFDEETADTYEVGMKSRMLDDTLQVNTAIFRTEYNDMQIQVQEGTSPTFRNAGDAEINGVEVETVYAPTNEFRLGVNGGYINARYTDLAPGVQFSESNELPKVPEWSASVSPEYAISLASGGLVTLRADYSYKSSVNSDSENTRELQSGETELLNLSVTYQTPDEKWSVTVGGTNVLDERYIANGVDQRNGAGLLFGMPNRPAEYYATMRVKL